MGRPAGYGIAGAVVAASVLTAGCNASSDASAAATTVEVAPPTTTPAVTTAQPTSTSSTVAPTTTVPPTSTAPATLPTTAAIPATTQPPAATTPEQSVTTRALDYKRATWKCLEQADQCDVDKLIAEYYAPGYVAEYVLASLNKWIAEGQRYTETEQITSTVKRVSVAPDELNAATTTCIRNGAVTVDSETDEVIDDAIGYSREETVWARSNEKWMIVDRAAYKVRPGEDDACGF